MRYDRQQNMRQMFVGGGATEHPTGVILGANVDGTVTVANDTKTTTAGDSVFEDPSVSGAFIHSIVMMDPAGPTGTLTLQAPDGTALGLVFHANGAGRLEFPDGIYIEGGFRVVSTTTGDVLISYELA